MVNKKSMPKDLALRIATAMHQMGIDAIPRNYELVYEAYGGANPDLVREFIALGKYKSQTALDELGRKYLPHHHEASVLARSTTIVRDEMSNFMNLLSREKDQLDDYGRLISEATKALVVSDDASQAALATSIQALKRATERQVSHNAELEQSVTAQSTVIAGVQKDLADFEARKFSDTVTGLANRRAFNKALAKVYADPDLPLACGIAIAEPDTSRRLSGEQAAALAEPLARHIGGIIQQAFPSSELVARFDGTRFGFLVNAGEEREVVRLVALLRSALRGTHFTHPKTGRDLGCVTLSVGICMSNDASNAFDLVGTAEKALARAQGKGGDQTIVHGAESEQPPGRDWLIYKQ
jgi:diguanylate cyclase